MSRPEEQIQTRPGLRNDGWKSWRSDQSWTSLSLNDIQRNYLLLLYIFFSDWKSIPCLPKYLLTIFPRSPCVYWLRLLRARKQINPSNNPVRTRSTKHCCIIQDATRMAAEWWNTRPTRCECAFCIPKHPISVGGLHTLCNQKKIYRKLHLQLKIFHSWMEITASPDTSRDRRLIPFIRMCVIVVVVEGGYRV